ncbi:ATP-binding cassette domain-containing protein, partial [Streptomyces albidoflavus]
MGYAIRAEGLGKKYGDFTALDGVDLEVAAGKVVGVLGPNGAGKTTTVRILATLMRPDAGHATIGGHDIVKDPVKWSRRTGSGHRPCGARSPGPRGCWPPDAAAPAC